MKAGKKTSSVDVKCGCGFSKINSRDLYSPGGAECKVCHQKFGAIRDITFVDTHKSSAQRHGGKSCAERQKPVKKEQHKDGSNKDKRKEKGL
jgi:hypothetical protein